MAHTHSFHAPEPDEKFASTVEPDHVNLRAVFGFGIGLAVVTAVAHFAMLGMFWMLDRNQVADQPARVFPIAVDEDARVPPEPRLQGGVQTDNAGRLLSPSELEHADHNPGSRQGLRELRAGEDTLLEGYSWLDRNRGVVQIPIDAAITLTLQRGLPARAQAADAPAPATSSTQAGQDKSK